MELVRGLILVMALGAASAFAAELNGIKMEDSKKVAEKDLVLNGMALRKVTKLGIPIKVYVAGLYLENKLADGTAILGQPSVKHLEMEFVRTVEKEKITDAWDESIFKGCIEDCANTKPTLKQFNDLMGEMRQGQRMAITFYPDKVEVNQQGRSPKTGVVEGAAFSKNLLAIFIGPKMFSQEVKESLLGKGAAPAAESKKD
ncbi:MAG: chalcone isomerase family protein [Bdellovibrionales bacterium]|nr:chalcone isomerase family protein [Bdellovibrionales bacterium]